MTNSPVNLLLRDLPAGTLEALDVNPIEVAAGTTLIEPGDRVTCVYFPLTAVLLQTRTLSDGARIAVDQVGFEGFAPVAAVVPSASVHSATEVMCSGKAVALSIESFTRAMQDGHFRRTMLEYVVVDVQNRGQLVACNRHHDSVQRLARWLLMTNDRTGDPHIALSQQFLADALGVSRQVTNTAIAELRRAQCIEMIRNELTILDRRCLVRESCECYGRFELTI